MEAAAGKNTYISKNMMALYQQERNKKLGIAQPQAQAQPQQQLPLKTFADEEMKDDEIKPQAQPMPPAMNMAQAMPPSVNMMAQPPKAAPQEKGFFAKAADLFSFGGGKAYAKPPQKK